MKNRKGQAALEFIMTYGWAVLVLLVMIAALAYFGVLNPQKYLPDKCLLTAGFDCRDFRIRDNTGSMLVQMTIVNKNGNSININYFNASYLKGSTYYSVNCTITNVGYTDTDQAIPVTCTMPAGSSPGAGQVAKIDILLINYTTPTGSYSHVASGSLQANVQT